MDHNDFLFHAKYAETWLKEHLPEQISYVLVTAIPDEPIKISGNLDYKLAATLLKLATESIEDYLAHVRETEPQSNPRTKRNPRRFPDNH